MHVESRSCWFAVDPLVSAAVQLLYLPRLVSAKMGMQLTRLVSAGGAVTRAGHALAWQHLASY